MTEKNAPLPPAYRVVMAWELADRVIRRELDRKHKQHPAVRSAFPEHSIEMLSIRERNPKLAEDIVNLSRLEQAFHYKSATATEENAVSAEETADRIAAQIEAL